MSPPISSSSRASSVSTRQSSGGGNTHTVQRGETMTGIARQHEVTLDNLKQANPQVKDPNRIFPGQQLQIPAGQPGPGQTGSTQTGSTQTPTPNRVGTPTSPYQDGTSRFDGTTSRPSVVGATPAAGQPAATPASDTALAQEFQATRTTQHVAGPRGATAGRQAAGATQPAQPAATEPTHGTLHLPVSDGTIPRVPHRLGTETGVGVSHTRTAQGRSASARERFTTERTRDGLSTTERSRSGTAQNAAGRQVSVNSQGFEVVDRRSGEAAREQTRTTTTDRGRQRTQTTTDDSDETAPSNVSASGMLFDQTLAGSSQFQGVHSNDQRLREDRTGAGFETHALAGQARFGTGGTVDLRNGDVNVGVNGIARADLVGASARAQVGTTTTMAGAGFVEGAGHVGARAQGGAGVSVNLSQGQATARVGVEGFAGAEVRASAGYENRYGGVAVTARGQAGIGGAAQAEASIRNGTVRVRADLGAAVGLGGRVTVDVGVNVGAIASDAMSAAGQAFNYAASFFR